MSVRNPRNKAKQRKKAVPRSLVEGTIRKFIFHYDDGLITSSNTVNTAHSSQCQLSWFADSGSLTNLFDQYRIDFMELRLLPCNQMQLSSTSVEQNGICYVVADYDDASLLSSTASALNYQKLDMVLPGNKLIRRIKPRAMTATGQSGSSTVTASVTTHGLWIDAANPNVLHYGFKYFIPQSSTTNLNQWRKMFAVGVSARYQR